MSGADPPILPDAVAVPFDRLNTVVGHPPRGGSQAARSLTATVVVIGPRERLVQAAGAMEDLASAGSVRALLIATGDEAVPDVRATPNAIAIEGIRPSFVNNAIASLRLSSLPMLIWWRGGSADLLPGVVNLTDRLVLDVEDSAPLWRRAAELFERTAITDLRWTRLTSWRALMAQFFDVDEVRTAAERLTRLEIRGSDPLMGQLFAGWLLSCLGGASKIGVNLVDAPGAAPLESVSLGEGDTGLTLALRPNRTCLQTEARLAGRVAGTRVVSVRSQETPALIREELRIRSRDLAFERALRASGVLA